MVIGTVAMIQQWHPWPPLQDSDVQPHVTPWKPLLQLG